MIDSKYYAANVYTRSTYFFITFKSTLFFKYAYYSVLGVVRGSVRVYVDYRDK